MHVNINATFAQKLKKKMLMGIVKGLSIIAILFCVTSVSAQNYRITGIIKDKQTKRAVTDAPVYVKGKISKGTNTDSEGKYVLSLPKGDYTLTVEQLGYEVENISVSLTKDMEYNFELVESLITLNEAIITTTKPDENVSTPQVGVQRMQVTQLNKLPVLFGEKDIIKSLELMPGVKSAGEGSSGFFVRGGTADQNLILLDNVSIYNASHLMGFFSTFNSDVLQDVTLYKGGIPAQFGDRLSAILDVQQRNGNTEKYSVSGGIGLISSKLNVEGPIQKGKSSFIVGARRTYADAIARASGIEEAQNAWLYFYDLNARLHFHLSKKDQLAISGYLGRDKMKLKDLAETGWGSVFGSVKWTRAQNQKLTFNTTLSYNRYSYDMSMTMGMNLKAGASLQDYVLKSEANYKASEKSQFKFGLQTTFNDIAPGKYSITGEIDSTLNYYHRYSWDNRLYASHQLKLTDKLELIYGLRLSAFSAIGEGEYYDLDENHEVTDSIWYMSGEFVKTHVNLEPRVSAAYKLNEASSVKASYSRTTQNMHLLTFVAQGSPYDRWIASSNVIKPQKCDQYTLGYFRNFADNMFELSIEGYYKNMKNQLDYKDNAEFFGEEIVETELRHGKGRAYGIELMFKKRVGRFNGWISYTLSKSEKKIDGVNNNEWYNAYQDRTHDISVVAMYELSKRWSLSAAWVYYTGNAITYPSGKYQIDGNDVMYYSERNGYRAPAYHRLDLGATFQLKKTSRFESELAFGLYNAYGRKNTYMINFRTNDDDPTKTSAYRYSLFTFVPSISWNFKF